MPEWIDSLNNKIDDAFELTQLPQLAQGGAEYVGRGFDSLMGTNVTPTIGKIAHDTPRMIAEGLLTIPEVASGAGAPIAAATWLNRLRKLGQIAGYTDAAVKGTADTGSYVGGAINAATLGLGNKLFLPETMEVPLLGRGLDVGGRAAKVADDFTGFVPKAIPTAEEGANLLTPNILRDGAESVLDARSTYQQLMSGGARAAADVATATAVGEAARQAQLSVGPNAVGLDDPARNPLTEENIVGAVTNALPMAVGGVVAGMAKFKPKQVTDLVEWMHARKVAEAVQDASDWEGPVSPTQYHDMFGVVKDEPLAWTPEGQVMSELKDVQQTPGGLGVEEGYNPLGDEAPMNRTAGVVQALSTHMEVLKDRQARNDPAAEDSKRAIMDILNGASAGLDTEEGLTHLKNTLGELDVTARQLPPADVGGLHKFIGDVNVVIDQLNENKKIALDKLGQELPELSQAPITSFSQIEGRKATTAARKRIEQEQAETTAQEGKSWRRDAVDPVRLGQLQEKNLIPKITEEWLRKEHNAEFNQSGDPQFAYHVVLQKVVNHLLDHVTGALEAEKSLPTVSAMTEFDTKGRAIRNQAKVDAEESVYVKALQAVPKHLENDIFERAVNVRNYEGALRGTTLEKSWQQKVVAAARSEDPATAFAKLVERDPNGKYVTKLTKGHKTVAQGGKLPIEQAYGEDGQHGFKDANTEGALVPTETPDEATYRQAVDEEKSGLAQAESVGDGAVTPVDENAPAVTTEATDTGHSASMEQTAGQVEKLRKVLPTLSDAQIATIAEPAFRTKPRTQVIAGQTVEVPYSSKPGDVRQRRALMRPALLAALEDLKAAQGTGLGPNAQAFLDLWHNGDVEKGVLPHQPVGNTPKWQLAEALRRMFGHQTEAGFENPVKGVRPDEQRLAYIVGRLTDDGVVKAAQGVAMPAGEVTAPVVTDTLVNTQPAGAFTGDVLRTFRTKFNQVLGQQGYSGTYRDLMTEMAVAVAQTAPEKMTDFYRISGKEWGLANYGMSGPERGQVGINVDEAVRPYDAVRYMNRLVGTLAHELSHIDTFILNGLVDAPDAFSERRRVHATNLRKLGDMMSPEEREASLLTLRNALVPEEYQNFVKDKVSGKIYGSQSGEEFVATVNELIAASLLKGKSKGLKTALEVLDYSPTEVREYAQGQYRAMGDIMAGMREIIAKDLKGSEAPINRYVTSSMFGAAVDAAREASTLRDADRALGQSRAFIASASPGAGAALPLSSPAMWFRTGKDIQENYRNTGVGPEPQAMASGALGIQTAMKFFTPKQYDKQMRPGVWASWFYPFTSLMESMQRNGFDLARPVANIALNMEAGVSRLRSTILEPFIVKSADGRSHWDETNTLIKKISTERAGPWRDATNAVSKWQQENDCRTMFVEDPKQGIVVNPNAKGAAAEWTKISARLSLEDQQIVKSANVSMDKVGQIKANVLATSMDEGNIMRTARTLMAMDRRMPYDVAWEKARGVVDAYTTGNAQKLQALVPDPKWIQGLDNLLGGKGGLIDLTLQVRKKLENRPGYRAESLPDKWVLRYEDPQGEVKFASAATEYKAQWLMRELTKKGMKQAGEIVPKDTLKTFTSFDDPDTLLRKFTELESAQWSKFTDSMQQVFSQDVVDELKTYIPGSAVTKELATKSLGQWLTDRKNMIDRDQYDYIDGTMSAAGRLAASVAFKSARQQKDLILADSRARMFPSFEKITNEHFENMMSPTGQWAKELKTFSTAMMMGGSMASTLINASQSVVSLVPILIQYDKLGKGPVAAWKAMGKAIADATAVTASKDWQARATAAEAIDPKSWTLEQAKSALYKRNVKDGGINHGIILDNVFSSTDQNALMQHKFGHGNYGPVTVGEMVRSPIYLASQLSLKPFGWVEQFNNKISLMAGVEQGYAQGLRGDQLYEHAKLVKTLSTYGGGKANAPGLVAKLSNPYTRSAVGVVNNLQQYGYGMVATYAQLVKDSLGQSKGLTPLERRQAQKAFGTLFATQVALGGALGLPFAAAALTAVEKVFGVPANQLVREGLASLGSDEDSGAAIAETSLNGLGNQMFGIDVSSRVGVSNLLGTSSYRGFNLGDMAGPTASLVGNAVKALGYFGQGEPMQAAHELVPNSFKNVVSLADSQVKHGDSAIRDSGGNVLYQPKPSEAAWYALGFRPKDVSQKRQAQAMLTSANQRATAQRGRELDQLGQRLLSGDPQGALQYAQNLRYSDPTVDPREVLRSIVNRSVDSVTERDLLASGPTSNEAERQRIAGTFSDDVVSRQSETQRTLLAAQLGAQVGLAPDAKAFQRAALVDGLVKAKGMPRSQALRLVAFLE